MDIRAYGRVLRQRWVTVAALGLVGLLVALLLSLLVNESRYPYTSGTTYTASTTLLLLPGSPTTTVATSTVVTSPRVAASAAAALRTSEDPADLISRVTVVPAEPDRTIEISASGPTAVRAAELANAFGEATVSDMRDRARDGARGEQARLREQLGAIEARIAANDSTTTAGAASLPVLTEQYAETFRALQEIGDPDRPTAPTDVIDTLIPADQATATANPFLPSSMVGRMIIGTVLGLLAGAAVALAVERFNSRPLSRPDMQRVYRTPVLAEIPRLPRRRGSHYDIATETDPGGAVADGYRSLLSAMFLVPRTGGRGAAERNGAGRDTTRVGPQVILVTSARPAEAKTATVVNLASCIARTGRTVLVVDFDVRGADAHLYLEASSRSGVRDFLHEESVELGSVIQPTDVAGVSMVTAGGLDLGPAWTDRTAELVRQARPTADVVLLDSPPILLGDTAINLVPHVDAVLVATFVGRTTEADAERACELLMRMRAPVVGLAVSGTSAPAGGDWARYRGPTRPAGAGSSNGEVSGGLASGSPVP